MKESFKEGHLRYSFDQSAATVAQETTDSHDQKVLFENDQYYIYEAKRSDLPFIVQLRTQVFHSMQIGDSTYFTERLLDLSSRYNLGSHFYLAKLRDTMTSSTCSETTETTSLLLTSGVIGTVEINDYDFSFYRLNESDPSLTYFGATKKLYLGDLAVTSVMRRQGIGSNLLKIIEQHAKINAYEEIYLHVDVRNPQILSFYRENGYEVYPYCTASLSFTQQRLPSLASNYLLLRRSLDP